MAVSVGSEILANSTFTKSNKKLERLFKVSFLEINQWCENNKFLSRMYFFIYFSRTIKIHFMNIIVSSFSALPKKEWINPEINVFELEETAGGRYAGGSENTYVHT